MRSVDLLINILVFIGLSLFMGLICINMPNSKADNRNTGAGYRTKGSMKSIDAWNQGNKIFGYCTIPIAIIEAIAIYVEDKMLIKHNIVSSENAIFINLVILIIGIIVGYIITENKIKHL